ncbi:MOSC domain-containing protein [Caballeronia sp. SEWSISQ10-4 2]|uniref:MOSC domain-containing protein n=1 Tax=Caballeronia sp. SEWSISQ10-4 2 TaxID=2937438 RepID=UPI00264AF5FE|nr:MOSC domain-containing protein [Caballeronia sp. SEWSISQ10-4 2]MDN7178616.1 MOSC domain-containing protein [Caballeronia sp. SEWSISQ10-4 2]
MNPVIDAVLAGVVAPLGTQGKYSAIHKVPVAVRVHVGETGMEGDHQFERKHHGGPEKALHHYSRDHYAVWRDEWPESSTGLTRFDTPGAFGENISTRGLNEADVCVGDMYRLGTVIVQVSQPRQPCWKLNLHFSRDDMSRRVQDTRRTGWYYRVLEPGEMGAGDVMERLARPHPEWSVERLLRVLYVDRDDQASLEKMAMLEALTPSWRSTAAKRLDTGKVESWALRLNTPEGEK